MSRRCRLVLPCDAHFGALCGAETFGFCFWIQLVLKKLCDVSVNKKLAPSTGRQLKKNTSSSVTFNSLEILIPLFGFNKN